MIASSSGVVVIISTGVLAVSGLRESRLVAKLPYCEPKEIQAARFGWERRSTDELGLFESWLEQCCAL